MVGVDHNFNSLGVSEILFRNQNNYRQGLISGMVFISGGKLMMMSGTAVVVFLATTSV